MVHARLLRKFAVERQVRGKSAHVGCSRPSSQKKGCKITWPPYGPEKLATHPATFAAGVVRESVPSISGMVLKHFDLLSPKMMLRSLPEVVRSSKNDGTFDHKTCCCLTLANKAQSCWGASGEPRSTAGGLGVEQKSPGAQQESPGAQQNAQGHGRKT